MLFSVLPFTAHAGRSLVIDAYREPSDNCGTGLFRTLTAAMDCAQPGDTIRYHCDPLYKPECVEPHVRFTKSNITLFTYVGSNPVVFRHPGNTTSPVVIFDPTATGSALYGFTVDGRGYETRGETLFPWTLVQVRADNVQITYSTIKNGRGGSCIRVDDEVNGVGRAVAGFNISNSTVQDCIRWSGLRTEDTHCIHTCNARDMSVQYNTIERCSGDGVQLENYDAVGCNNGPGWANIGIIGNTFRTGPDTRVRHPVTSAVLTPGENAIDAKRTRNQGLWIRNNTISGHRGWGFPVAGGPEAGHGTGGGSSKGEGIVVQGRMEQCTIWYPMCMEVVGNNITNTNLGISFTVVDSAAGYTAWAAHNVIHNLSADSWDPEPAGRGAGIRAGNLLQTNLMHNTLVNLPGLPIYQEGPFRNASISGTYSSVHSNLISNAGAGCSVKGGDADYIDNNCFNGPNAANGKNSCQIPRFGSAGFANDSSQWYPAGCGMAPSVTPVSVGASPNYDLTCNSAILDSLTSTATAYQNACQGRAGNTARMDPGAREYCGPVCP